MALPIVPAGSVLRVKFYGGMGGVHDLLNVQYFVKRDGVSPAVGGLDIGEIATNALEDWAALWKQFQSNEFTWEQCSVDWIGTLTGIGGSQWRATLLYRWSVLGSYLGVIASDSLPGFCAFGVLKKTARPGRGSTGSVRISGVPESSTDGDILEPIPRAAIQTYLNALTDGALSVHVGLLASDFLEPVLIDGHLINLAPGNPLLFYVTPVNGAFVMASVRSQITREVGRRRHRRPPAGP